MTDFKFQPGDFAHDKYLSANLGVGVVVASDGVNSDGEERLLVDFWGKEERRSERWLTPVDPDSPDAQLIGRPEELASWAEVAPLKLVALALSVGGGSGNVSDIRAKLDGRVIEDGKWKNWWSKRTKALATLPKHFNSFKAPKGNQYTLLTGVDDVPADWKSPPKPSPAVLWKEWLESGQDEPLPGRYPPKAVADALGDWSPETIDYALGRTLQGARSFLASERLAKPAAAGWLEAVGKVLIRRLECNGPFNIRDIAPEVTEILMTLSRKVGYSKSGEWLLLAGALGGQSEQWQQGFAAGVWMAVQESGSNARRNRRSLVRVASNLLGHQNRAELAREIAFAALRVDDSPRQYPDLDELDHLLDDVTEGEGAQRISEMIVLTASYGQDDKDKLLNYIANSHLAAGPERLNLLVMATILLTDGTGDLAKRASLEFDRAMTATNKTAADGLYRATRSRIEEEMAALRALHQADLEREQQEQEQLRQQVRERNSELAANRKESRLEIMQDTLMLAGEVFQCAPRWDSLEEAVRDTEAGLTRALRVGGAELFESATTIVEYDPQKHSAEAGLSEGCWVKIVAPGVIYRGGIHGDRVLLKAQVKREAG